MDDSGILPLAGIASVLGGLAVSRCKHRRFARQNQGSEKLMTIAAFFDVDGTLLPAPSLEWRFFRSLRYRHIIPTANYFMWLGRAVRLAPRGIHWVLHANKMYLRGVANASFGESAVPKAGSDGSHVLPFFPGAIERIAWHASEGHHIVLLSGTLMPLAQETALLLMMRLAARGITASIGVCATRLTEDRGQWTGEIFGKPMFGKYKADAMKHLAAETGFNLSYCFAYGNSVSDKWMLAAVAQPIAVNPSPALAHIAARRDWPVVWWLKR
jgi:phosphoserine phosphatase